MISLATHLVHLVVSAAPGGSVGHGDGQPLSRTTAFIIAAAALVVGIANAVRPDLAYKLSKWQFRNPEAVAPSHAALLWTRIGGCLAIVAGIVFLVIGFTR